MNESTIFYLKALKELLKVEFKKNSMYSPEEYINNIHVNHHFHLDGIINQIKKLFPSLNDQEVLKLLALLRLHYDNEEKNKESFNIVTTYPGMLDQAPLTQSTVVVIKSLIAKANESILLTGYSISPFIKEILELIKVKSEAGLHVEVFVDCNKSSLFLIHYFSQNKTDNVKIYILDKTKVDDRTALHAKLLVIDKTTALISSANLSENGFMKNIEVGAVVTGEKVSRIHELFHLLKLNGIFIQYNLCR